LPPMPMPLPAPARGVEDAEDVSGWCEDGDVMGGGGGGGGGGGPGRRKAGREVSGGDGR
jgi:hypothetical protein